MKISVKRILNKKNPTGREAGLVLLWFTRDRMLNADTPNYKPVCSIEDIVGMERKFYDIDKAEQLDQYQIYKNIYYVIVKNFDFIQMIKQQFFHGFYRAYQAIRETNRVECYFKMIDSKHSIFYKDLCGDIEGGILQDIDFLMANKDEAESITNTISRLVSPALAHLHAFNAFIDALALACDVDFLDFAKVDISDFEVFANSYNSQRKMLLDNIDKAGNEHKIKFVEETFLPIDLEASKPAKEAVDNLKTIILSQPAEFIVTPIRQMLRTYLISKEKS